MCGMFESQMVKYKRARKVHNEIFSSTDTTATFVGAH